MVARNHHMRRLEKALAAASAMSALTGLVALSVSGGPASHPQARRATTCVTSGPVTVLGHDVLTPPEVCIPTP